MDSGNRDDDTLAPRLTDDATNTIAEAPDQGRDRGDDQGGVMGTIKGAVSNLVGGRTSEGERADADDDLAPGAESVGGGVVRDVGSPTGSRGLDDYQEAIGGESTPGTSDYRRDEEGETPLVDRGFDSEPTSY